MSANKLGNFIGWVLTPLAWTWDKLFGKKPELEKPEEKDNGKA